MTFYTDLNLSHSTDVTLMDDPSWASYSLPLVESQCEAGLWRQSRKWRKLSSDERPPKEILDVLNCPNLCSGRGFCNGKKCVCNLGFSGPGCSGEYLLKLVF